MNAPFTLSEDHLAFRQSVRTLARSRYADSMLQRSQSEKFPTAEFGELGDAGLLGLLISESAGGQGGDVLAVGIAVEELAYADPVDRLPGVRGECQQRAARRARQRGSSSSGGSPAVSPARPSSASR